MRAAKRSDRGLVRENNEDFVLADQVTGLFLLADGMGGGPAGEVASELAVSAARGLLAGQRLVESPEDVPRLLAEGLAAAHSAVAKAALADPALEGMGTTLDLLLVRGLVASLCHVGDSRMYLFRRGELRPLTTDDNYAAVLAEVKKVPVEQIPPAYRHILTQVVGLSEELVPEIRQIELKPGDLLLMCSDGLTGALNDVEIEAIMGRTWRELDDLADALVAAANEKSGADNVSVVIVEPVPAVASGTLPAAKI
ncbi:PP2C family protein-serine/threonine phosphatase [Geomonas sp.]|uniref:PP2C family protein-serine/threonine phosphatase n=1 Tax=Geomonas sp. TaxID=2651584 RepID=UPI002B49FCDF|nr:protein phosphatase 2C domain-containing protein [Geomonas sp.]HJV33495.1 protein phosphatase 2C domain-containing protein [Geomonas sp.]